MLPGVLERGQTKRVRLLARRSPQAKLLACPARTAALLPQVLLLPLPGTVRMKRVSVVGRAIGWTRISAARSVKDRHV
jgi:hypothetical protein